MNGTSAQVALLAVALVAVALAGIRWLRVAQREHYLAGSVVRFARRWWSLGPNRLLGAAALVGLAAAAVGVAPAGVIAVAAAAVGPFGLSLRGRTAKLAWTRRLGSLGATAALLGTVVIAAAAAAAGVAGAAAAATLIAIAAPVVVDAALIVTAPIERRLGRRFVDRATTKLAAVHPTVVAITGSYGKTTTKGYLAHLLTGSVSVVPTPKSYNNQAGLARAINEQLAPGTDVFVAEMGTYGPGEIAQMCSWVVPDVAAITAVGPVHLERMGHEERVAQAKAEILDRAKVAVLNVDNQWLAGIAARLDPADIKLWRCSAVDRDADVCVAVDSDSLRIFHRLPGESGPREIARSPGIDAAPTNVAIAVAIALELGVGPEQIAARLGGLPTAPNRRQVTTGRSGAVIIDDTYNANPAGAAAALELLERLAGPGHQGQRRIVVTPGMVELGPRQAEENEAFARAACAVATDLVVVGSTNAGALIAGARGATAEVVRMATRDQAVAWVVGQVGPGDVVLYENDLPDHFP